MDWSKISEIAKQYADNTEYDTVAIRIQDYYGEVVGQIMSHNSMVWFDGEKTDEVIDGVCAIEIGYAARNGRCFGGYDGDTALVLGSNHTNAGEDAGEVVMRNAVVIAVIR